MSQFIIPDFIKNADVNKIHKRMRDNLPNDIDKSEGSDVWNLTYPTAYEHAYFAQFCILNALRLIWPNLVMVHMQIITEHAEAWQDERRSMLQEVSRL